MSKVLKRVEQNIKYIREQINRFMRYEYGVKYEIDVYGHKGLEREGYFSRVEFKGGRPVAIDISYGVLAKGNRDFILKTGLREAIKVVLWYRRIPYGENQEEYKRELIKYKLPVYGLERQTGKYMHAYGCSKCKSIYVLQDRKLPVKKDITKKNFITKCCSAKFEYMDKEYYGGEDLYRIRRGMRERGAVT